MCIRTMIRTDWWQRVENGRETGPGYVVTADCGMLAGWSPPRRYAAADAPPADLQGRPPT